MQAVKESWQLETERGPDWVYVRLNEAPSDATEVALLAERVWQILEQHFCYRVVLECDRVALLFSPLVGQFVLLHKRVTSRGGLMRLSGLSEGNQSVLRVSRLDVRFPQYCDRQAAVLGDRPRQPR